MAAHKGINQHLGFVSMTKAVIAFLCFLALPAVARVAEQADETSLSEVRYLSTADQTMQPAMFYAPPAKAKVPLVVALHSWSGDYRQKLHNGIASWCMKKGWAYIHPDFRGPNNKPAATGSELVVKDIISAVEYAKAHANIAEKEIYLIGTSGGGYHALLMAGRAPEIWTGGVSAWVPISDLTAWYHETKKANRKYYKDIMQSCGGPPGQSAEVDEQYRLRSPLTYLSKAKRVQLHINAGIRDGHTGSVPISHSLRAFNTLATANDQLTESEIEYFVKRAKVPPNLQQKITDPSFGKKQPLFCRTSANTTVTIFNGGHELIEEAALAWFEQLQGAKQTKQ